MMGWMSVMLKLQKLGHCLGFQVVVLRLVIMLVMFVGQSSAEEGYQQQTDKEHRRNYLHHIHR